MPTYEYECAKCKHRFEEFQRISDKPLAMCPRCGGVLNRVISGGAGLIFKGSGFYVTDYKKKNLPKEESKPKPDRPAEKPAVSAKLKTPQDKSNNK